MLKKIFQKLKNSNFSQPIKKLQLINVLTLIIVVLNFLILIYFYLKKDVVFNSTSGILISINVSSKGGYLIIFVAIVFRIIFVGTTSYFANYIQNFDSGSEKKKKNSIFALTAMTIFTIPLNFPLIKTFLAYQKNSEILFHHGFGGTFRRILTLEERKELYEDIVQNFVETSQVSKGVKTELKNYALENMQSLLENYDKGSAFAKKYILEEFESQKELFQLKELLEELLQIEELASQFSQLGQLNFEGGEIYLDPCIASPFELVAAGTVFLLSTYISYGVLSAAVDYEILTGNTRRNFLINDPIFGGAAVHTLIGEGPTYLREIYKGGNSPKAEIIQDAPMKKQEEIFEE